MASKINTGLLVAVLTLLVYGLFVRPQPGRYMPLTDAGLTFRLARSELTTAGTPPAAGALVLDTKLGRICDSRIALDPILESSREAALGTEDDTEKTTTTSRYEKFIPFRGPRNQSDIIFEGPVQPKPRSIPFCSELR